MELSSTDIQKLLQFIAEDGNMGCEQCFCHIAEFAENNLEGKTIPLALLAISDHLEHCPCCQVFFELFIEALKECDRAKIKQAE